MVRVASLQLALQDPLLFLIVVWSIVGDAAVLLVVARSRWMRRKIMVKYVRIMPGTAVVDVEGEQISLRDQEEYIVARAPTPELARAAAREVLDNNVADVGDSCLVLYRGESKAIENIFIVKPSDDGDYMAFGIFTLLTRVDGKWVRHKLKKEYRRKPV